MDKFYQIYVEGESRNTDYVLSVINSYSNKEFARVDIAKTSSPHSENDIQYAHGDAEWAFHIYYTFQYQMFSMEMSSNMPVFCVIHKPYTPYSQYALNQTIDSKNIDFL